jgi:two-component system sensor histidine kinase KdpD
MADDRPDRIVRQRDGTEMHVVSYFAATVITGLATLVAWLAFGSDQLPDVVMTYLLGIMLVSSRYGLAPSVFAAFLSVAAVNFLFVPPLFTFAVADLKHAVTFVVMFVVAVVTSGLTERARDQARAARDAVEAQLALAMERAELAEETQKARREVEVEQLRSSLLSSVSHDLRTPLAVITGAASTLLESPSSVDEATRRELVQTILEESERLNRLIRNLLDMTRLESGAVKVNKEWLPLEEVVGAVLNRSEPRLKTRDVRTKLPDDLPLVPFDAVLIDVVLTNLLENAMKYGADPIEINATLLPAELVVEVSDRGPGLPPGEEARVFEKFQRAASDAEATSVGLGLAICRAIVAAHGGRIWAENRPGGGASFRFALPIEGEAPKLAPPEALDGAAE